MTPEEKAKELVESFKQHSYYDAHDLTTRSQRERSNRDSAIECALICVNEIIKAVNFPSPEMEHQKNHWQSVKEEINRL